MNGMEITNKLLTIAIPTYNRKNYLENCLNRLIHQLTDEVQIVVRDNHSTNYDFHDFIKSYVSKYGIIAHQNKCNIGIEGNITRLFDDCDTQWLWVLGDDDYILDDAISIVLNRIKNNPSKIYIKFSCPIQKETVGLNEFADYFRIKGEFGRSFFISIGLHNTGISKEVIQWQYRYMSTMIGQILRVVKYLELHDDGECLFCTEDLLNIHGTDISWKPRDLASLQLLVFDLFKNIKNILTPNIFSDIVRYCITFISSSKISQKEKIGFYCAVISKYGPINFLRYNGYLFKDLIILKVVGIRDFFK